MRLLATALLSLAIAAGCGSQALAPQALGSHGLAAPVPARAPAPGNPIYLPITFKQMPAVIVGAGDIADCSMPWTQATSDLVTAIPGTVITLGDNAYELGTPDEFNTCYNPTWGRFKNRTRPSPGNHDYAYPNAAGYFSYFGTAAGDPARGYYSFDLAGWHVLSLNANCDNIGGCQAGSAEEQWLRADLAAHPAACTLAYWHQPRYSSGSHGSDATYTAFWQALYDYHATLVLNGHDHDYERFAPQDQNGALDLARGIREFVVGTGGRHFSAFGPTRRPNSEASQSGVYGVIKLTLFSNGYQWDYVPVAGFNFHDTGQGVCQGP